MAYDYKDTPHAPEQAATPVFYEGGKRSSGTGSPKKPAKKAAKKPCKPVPCKPVKSAGKGGGKKNTKPLTKAAPARSTTGAQSVRDGKVAAKPTSSKDPTMAARSPKQIAATKKLVALNKKKAREAAGKGAKPKKKAAKGAERTPKQEAATRKMLAANKAARAENKPKKAPKKPAKKGPKKGAKAKSANRASSSIQRRGQGASAKIDLALNVRGPSSTAPKKKGASKKPSKGGKGKGKSRAKEAYMAENPIGLVEGLVGAFTLVLGFLASDVVDRTLATHALTAGTAVAATSTTPAMTPYTDPTDTSTGTYKGLYNATAILAPMNAKRWIVGGLISVAPIGIAALPMMRRSNVGRSALQMFGFGYGTRWLGKGLIDILSKLIGNTGMGQRLYDAELRGRMAQASASGVAYTGPQPPSTITGAPAPAAPPGLGQGHAHAGCGTCINCQYKLPCSGGAQPPAPPSYVAPPSGNPGYIAPPSYVAPPSGTTGYIAPPTGRTPAPNEIGAGSAPSENTFGLYSPIHSQQH